jgi:hypothetical protein
MAQTGLPNLWNTAVAGLTETKVETRIKLNGDLIDGRAAFVPLVASRGWEELNPRREEGQRARPRWNKE